MRPCSLVTSSLFPFPRETRPESNRIIQDLVAQIVCNFGALYKASEAVCLNFDSGCINNLGFCRSH